MTENRDLVVSNYKNGLTDTIVVERKTDFLIVTIIKKEAYNEQSDGKTAASQKHGRATVRSKKVRKDDSGSKKVNKRD